MEGPSRMARKSKRTATQGNRNLAGKLHEIVSALAQQDIGNAHKVKQRALLQGLLGIPNMPGQESAFHTRLAQLHALPERVRAVLEAQDAPEQFLAWYEPVAGAVGSLHGGPGDHLAAFALSPPFIAALTTLELCAVLLRQEDVCWDGAALEELKAVIDAAMKLADELEDATDPEVRQWLRETLDEMHHVIETTEIMGVAAGRDEMYALVGRARCRPCPRTQDSAALSVLESVVDISKRLGPLLHLAKEGVRLLGE